jgi:Uncharacterised nucleotidyltransferase
MLSFELEKQPKKSLNSKFKIQNSKFITEPMNGHQLYYQFIPRERRREIELLLLCARPRPDAVTIQDITTLANKEIDWKYLIETARSHKLHLLLYRSLKKACPESVPDEYLKKLERAYATNSMRCLLFSGKLLSILKLLEEKSIPAIPFKGPVLAETVYGDIALRQFGDLDILVHRENALEAIQTFEDHGFQLEINLNQKQILAYAAKKNSIGLISTISGLTVDLHWEMSGGYTFYPLILSSMENHLVHSVVAGQKVRQPSTEDLLIYLCLHGTRDCWKVMESLSSLAGLIQSNCTLDWMRVGELAKRMRCERILYLGLFLAWDLFDVELPEDIIKRVKKDPVLPKLTAAVYKRLLSKNNGSGASEINSKFSMFHLRARDRWSEKIRYGKHLVFGATAQEWTRVPVPAKLSFVYNILRPVRLSLAFLASRLRGLGIKDQGVRVRD